MNVLYLNGEEAAVLGKNGFARGPLKELRALTTETGAKGTAVLLSPAEINRAELPEGLPLEQALDYLSSQRPGTLAVSRPGAVPVLYGAVEQTVFSAAQGAAKGAGLKLTQVVPVFSAALRATNAPESVVIVLPLEETFEITTLTRNRIQSRPQARNERMDEERVIKLATAPLISSGDQPLTLLIDADVPEGAGHVQRLSLEEVMRSALQPVPVLTEGGSLTQWAAGIQGTVGPQRKLPVGLLIGTGLSLLMLGGLAAAKALAEQKVSELQVQQQQLQIEASAVQKLRSINDQLQARNEQARQLTGNKGPLVSDLPLIAGRVTEQGAKLQTLAGPNTPTENDTRAFGTAVQRTYDLTAQTNDAEGFTSAFQRRGLAADVQSVSCSNLPCLLNLRAAPTELNVDAAPAAPRNGDAK